MSTLALKGVGLVKRALLVALLALSLASCAAEGDGPGVAPSEDPAAGATADPGGSESTPPAGEASAGPSIEPDTDPAPTAAPAGKVITLNGKGSRKSKPFKMSVPARVDLTYKGSGNFISTIEPTSGSALDTVFLSNTIGKTKLRTYVYDLDLDGVKSFADVIAGGGAWTIKITPGVPAPIAAPATFKDKWGLRTQLFSLGGDYTVTYSHKGSGNFIVYLMPFEGSIFDAELLVNDIGRVSQSTEVYGADGDYYFDVVADGAWTISIKPQG